MKLSAILLILVTTCLPLQAKTTVNWGTDVWAGFTETNGDGFYHQLMSEVFNNNDYQIKIEYLSWKRSLKYLQQGTIDTTGSMPLNAQFYFSDAPILTETIYAIVYKNDEQQCCHSADMIGAYRHGYEQEVFYQAIPSEVNGVGVDSADQGIELLLEGKVDFYVDIGSILKNSLQSEDRQALALKAIGQYELHWAFSHTPEGHALKTHFDNRIRELKRSGWLQKLYQQYQLDFPDHQ